MPIGSISLAAVNANDPRPPMKRVLACCALLAAALSASHARAEMTAEAARASVAPFYKALNAEFAKDSADLIRQATAPEWVSCRGNDVCNSRDEVIAGIGRAPEIRSGPEMADQGRSGIGQSGHRSRRSNRHAGRRVHGRSPYRQIIQGDVDRRSHHRRRQDGPLLPHRGLDRRGPAAHGEVERFRAKACPALG